MRYQFVDRILHVDAKGAGTIQTLKTFPRGEDYFDGTFRGQDEVPASLLLESMAFAGGLLLCIRSGYTAQGLLLKVNRATFTCPVMAGEPVTVRSRLIAAQGDWTEQTRPDQGAKLAQTLAQCLVGEKQVAEGDLLFLGLPLEVTLGSRKEELLVKLMDLVALASR